MPDFGFSNSRLLLFTLCWSIILLLPPHTDYGPPTTFYELTLSPAASCDGLPHRRFVSPVPGLTTANNRVHTDYGLPITSYLLTLPPAASFNVS